MILPDGYAHVTMSGSGPGMPEGWAWTFGLSLPGSGETPQSVADGIRADLQSSTLMTNFQATVIHESVLVKFGPSATGPSAENTSALAGSAAGSQAPPNVAVLVTKNTAFGGRAGKGRMYLPPLNETSLTADGLIDSSLRAAIQVDVDVFFNAIEARGWLPVVLHGANSPLSTPSVIQSYAVDGRVATQRRRLRR